MVVEAMQTALGDSHQKTLDEMLTAYGLVANTADSRHASQSK